ncbi:3-keto-5-aminohexanoate cleavage protein [Burkholderia cenocepacia]|uniref:3-keto-5-aminohexanoate cleavage protein n=1 Tax=Burkholderia cenocepacia TaxID=95486 RepID=UPI000F5B513E|nr:3-keto-5-aminohexanoate cleavage protein [Burkholderia cenocepacia]RQU49161.1 hypothetical protein DF143_37190 [Burkholderia cenocepacia]RQV32014.1 hypothetical protein DF033_36750 [Burkholderia cenocepacia]
MNKQMYITAALVGATPKYINPLAPSFIPSAGIDLIKDETNRNEICALLSADGWEPVTGGGVALRQGFSASVCEAEIDASANPEQIKQGLIQTGWHNYSGQWLAPDDGTELSANPIIKCDLINQLKSPDLIRQLVLELTTFGWIVTEQGDLLWPYKRVHTYLRPTIVQSLQTAWPDFIQGLITNGWHVCGAGWSQRGKARSPYLPLSPKQIVDEARKCVQEGAAMVHLHTRDRSDARSLLLPTLGTPITIDTQRNQIVVDDYDAIITSLHQLEPSVILNVSTSARGDRHTAESPIRRAHLKQYGPTKVTPDVASLSPGPVVFQNGGGYDNSHHFLAQQIAHFSQHGIRPEIEVFNRDIVAATTGAYRHALIALGEPVLFMLVAGIDQYRRDPVSGEVDDDSLIETQTRKQITALMRQQTDEAIERAVAITVDALSPTVQHLRQNFPASKISILLPGPLQRILVDVAIKLDLDGIRIGLEDGLNVFDPYVPGGIRKALGTHEQVRVVREELEARGICIEHPEALREELGLRHPDVNLFRDAMISLQRYSDNVTDRKSLPRAHEIVLALSPVIDAYRDHEDRFARALVSLPTDTQIAPAQLADKVRALARDFGLRIRFSIEEQDRYTSTASLNFSSPDIPLALNFAREILADRSLPTHPFDRALDEYGQTDSRSHHKDATYRIGRDQFKPISLRCIEYLASIPCRLNLDRTDVYNVLLRQVPRYSETMALLHHAIRELMLDIRARSNAPAKQAGVVWYLSSQPSEPSNHAAAPPNLVTRTLTGSDVSTALHFTQWVALPSTPTTHYPLGLKLSRGLTRAFQHYLSESVSEFGKTEIKHPVQLLGITHTGRQQNGETVIESSLLYNRFAQNSDASGTFYAHTSRLIYERLMLPRLIKDPDSLAYSDIELVMRDSCGFPLRKDGMRAQRIAATDIQHTPFLKILAHSSGISTAQQMDTLMRKDALRLGFSEDELFAMFDRAIVISFGTTSDISLQWAGTSAVDITAYNDIRSLAGTTTSDYLLSPGRPRTLFRHRLASARSQHNTCPARYDHARLLMRTGAHGKSVARLADVFLFDDPARRHDGHSIRRYLDGSPNWLRSWMAQLFQTPVDMGATDALALLHNAYVSATQRIPASECRSARRAMTN